jgi:ribonuclease BN (tRNA processing enzyme)
VKLTLIPPAVGAPDPHQFLSSTLIDDVVCLDAGCIGFHQSPQEQARIRHVLLSHTHQDHVASLPIFVENAYEGRPDCVTIHGSAAVLDSLQRDVFNDRIWPDFIGLSRNNPRPFLKLATLEAGRTVELEGLRFTTVALDHVVPTVGFIIQGPFGSVAHVSDTAPTQEIWQRLNALSDLRAVFLEVTFPNNMQWLADISKHLTPATFGVEVRKLRQPARIIAVHLKARYRDPVIAEVKALGLPNLEIGQFGQPYLF